MGCRILTKAPAVSATAAILIALVIGGNTTVFSSTRHHLQTAGPRRRRIRHRNLLLATVNTSATADDAEGNLTLVEALRERLARLPGVEWTSYIPAARLSSWGPPFPVRRDRAAQPVTALEKRVASGFFSTLGVPFIAGQDFRPGKTRTRRSVIVTGELAKALWPGESALGKVLIAGPDARAVEAKVVGVVKSCTPRIVGSLFTSLQMNST